MAGLDRAIRVLSAWRRCLPGRPLLSVWDGGGRGQLALLLLGSSLKRHADGRVKPGHDENGRKRGPSGGSEKADIHDVVLYEIQKQVL